MPLMNMALRVNSCEVFTDILKISFVPQFVNSRYEMCRGCPSNPLY